MNIVVVCLDTFRADLIGRGDLSFVQTPNLDAFARESAIFDRAFGEGQPTLQMRRGFFTGRRSFPWRYNVDRRGHVHHAAGWHKIPADQDTVAEILLSRGYFTGLVADTYHMFKPTMNYTRGFLTWDFIRGQETDAWRGGTIDMIADKLQRHSRWQPGEQANDLRLIRYLWNQRDRAHEEDYSCAKVFRSAARWLEDNHRNTPFFLWVDSFDPHEPWDPPAEYVDRYAPGYGGIDFIFPISEGATPSEQERIKALYYGEVTLVDRWLGHLFDQIDALKLWDDTLVVVTCDHGTQLMEHGRFGKSNADLHPFNTQLIWLMRHPDGPRGSHIPGFVQSHDLLPTLLNLTDIPYANVDGQDIWPLVTGEREAVRDHVVIGWSEFAAGNATGRCSVRDNNWNYVVAVGREDPAPELYDLEQDPKEVHNVHDLRPDIVARHRSRLEAVVGQPLPGQLNEVCDLYWRPFNRYWELRPR